MLCSNAFNDKLCIFSKQENWQIKYMQALFISQADDLGIEVSMQIIKSPIEAAFCIVVLRPR